MTGVLETAGVTCVTIPASACERLFDVAHRSGQDSARRTEPVFQYLNRSARPMMSRVREVMEDWFSRYPINARPRMRGALLKPKDRRQEYAAFWELYLHETFLRAGWPVDVREGTPDFALTTEAGALYVEATSASPSNAEVAALHRLGQLFDTLDRTNSGRWRLCLNAEPGPGPAPGRKFRRAIEAWLKSLDFEKAFAGRTNFDDWPIWVCNDAGWQVEIRATPVGFCRQTDAGALSWWGPCEVTEVTNDDGLRSSIAAKLQKCARSYDAPLILAIGLSRDFGHDYQMTSALYGTEGMEYTIDRRGTAITDARPIRGGDGIWRRADRRVAELAAVLAATRLTPFSIARSKPCLWINPWRSRSPQVLPSHLPWRQHWLDEQGTVREAESADPAAFFGLPADWPGED